MNKIVSLFLVISMLILFLNSLTACNVGEQGPQGEQGTNGEQGTSGDNCKTPQIRINPTTLEWEVSYDEGQTWIGLGHKADVDEGDKFAGLKISILGDSISTYINASNGTAANITNSTISNNVVYYTAGKFGVYQSDTWWQQTADALGGSILVNNSWSGSCVFATNAGTVGAYVDRCVQLHDDTGENSGEEPDLIFVYLGTNDATLCSSRPLGDYGSIDFSALIQDSHDGYVYAEPTTASEAYAIMIHKMVQRYTDAEIYCMIPCQRKDGSDESIEGRLKFYDAISKISNRFGAFTIDLYNKSGITTDADAFTTFIPDNSLHPGCEGMDAITSTVLSALYQNSKYAPVNKQVYSVSYETDAIILEGRKYAVLENESFSCTIKEKTGYAVKASVFMNGEDITESACDGNSIFVEKVTGNLIIKAVYNVVYRDPSNFRFETINDQLVSVTTDNNTENAITQLHGSISDGLYTSCQFLMDTTVQLLHDKNWAIEWKVKGAPYMLLLSGQSSSSANVNGSSYLFIHGSTPMVALGEYIGPSYANYACKYDAYLNDDYHIYRLQNQVNAQGNNRVYLYIDGVKIGEMNNCYKDTHDTNQTSDWVNGRDFFFSYIGTVGSHPISNCYLEYIQIWENIE